MQYCSNEIAHKISKEIYKQTNTSKISGYFSMFSQSLITDYSIALMVRSAYATLD